MAKAQGLTLKDLLETQRKLAAAGDKQAEAQVSRLEAMEKEESAVPTVTQPTGLAGGNQADQVKQMTQQTEELKKINTDGLEEMKKDIHKGLVEKSGDGLNSNVIKLSKDIRTSIGGAAAATRPGAAVPIPPEEDREKARAAKGDNIDTGSIIGDFVATLKKAFTIEGAFNVEQSTGPLGNALKRRVARNQQTVAPITESLAPEGNATAVLAESKQSLVGTEDDLDEDQKAAIARMDAALATGKVQPIPEPAQRTFDPEDDLDEEQKAAIARMDAALATGKIQPIPGQVDDLDEEQKAAIARMDAALATGKVQPIPGPQDDLDEEQKAAIARMDAALATGKVQPIPSQAKPVSLAPQDDLDEEQKAAIARMDAALATGQVQPALGNSADQMATQQREDIDRMNAAVRGQFAPTATQPIVPDSAGPSLLAAEAGSTTEEIAENARLMAEQTDLLRKIEENTRGGAGGGVRREGKPAEKTQAEPEGGGGSLLGDVADFAMDKFGKKGGAGKAASVAKGFGGKALQFMGSKGGAVAGAALAVGAGAYTAYEGWQTASQNEEGQKKAIDQAVATGQITKEEGEAKKVQAEQVASVGKGEAVGEGGGMAAGAIGGAALGASIGSIIPGAGTVVGGLLGGAVGGIAGSSAGKALGGYAVKGYQGVKSFFGGEDAAKPVGEEKPGLGSKVWDFTKKVVPGVGLAGMAYDAVTGLAGDKVAPASAVAPTPSSADMITAKSADNAGAATQQVSSPTVISAPSNSTNINQTTSYTTKSPTRNSESSVRQFINSRYAY